MVGAQLLLADGQSALVQRLRLTISPQGLIDFPQVVQASSCLRMIGTQLLLVAGQHLLIERLSVSILSLSTITFRQRVLLIDYV
jgi:hypothetical protein